MTEQKDQKLAVLIDADNVPYENIKGILNEVTKFGIPTIKRIYGDWTKPTVSGWKPTLLENAITPIQQYSYTSGKNATDSAMIIDAMDILHDEKVDGFCLVSSDSDFTRLATRLRESGKFVLGIGEKKTPKPFIVACDKFVYIEVIDPFVENDDLTEENEPGRDLHEPHKIAGRKITATGTIVNNVDSQSQNQGQNPPVLSNQGNRHNRNIDKIDIKLIRLLQNAIDIKSDDDEEGWALLADVGNLIMKQLPDFDSRNYGFSKLSKLLASQKEYFEIQELSAEQGGIKIVFVRNR